MTHIPRFNLDELAPKRDRSWIWVFIIMAVLAFAVGWAEDNDPGNRVRVQTNSATGAEE